jgi:hypothetical protein
MAATRRRRIIRWTVIAVVAPLLLLSSYVSAWLAMSSIVQKGVATTTAYPTVTTSFRPIYWYCMYDLPGGRTLRKMWWTVIPPRIPPGEDYIILHAWELAPPHPNGAPNDNFRSQ